MALFVGVATGFSVTFGGVVSTVNVTGGSLVPVPPRLVWVACAVYFPSARVWLGPTDQLNPGNGAVSVCTNTPSL